MPPNHLHAPSRLLFITCATLIRLACAQECFYPNGNPTLEPDAPCNDGTGNCCPLNWECLSNGLCYLPNQGYLQRTTCMSALPCPLFNLLTKTRTGTDKNWGPTCAQFCTYEKTAAGNEAILRCRSGVYCCDKNRAAGDCCTDPGFITFSLADGMVVTTIMTVGSDAPPSTLSPISQPSTVQQLSHTESSSTTPSSPTTNAPPASTTSAAYISPAGASGSTSITSSTIVQIPAATGTNTFILQSPPSSTASSSNSNVAKVVAPIVGVGGLILLALVALIAVLKIRSRNQRLLRDGQGHDRYYGQSHDGHYVQGYDGHYGQGYNGDYR
jgi:hypothetical protein